MKKFLAVSVAAAGIVSTVFMGGCAKSLFYKFAVDIGSEWTENSTPIIDVYKRQSLNMLIREVLILQ